jgi:hypothetical protein
MFLGDLAQWGLKQAKRMALVQRSEGHWARAALSVPQLAASLLRLNFLVLGQGQGPPCVRSQHWHGKHRCRLEVLTVTLRIKYGQLCNIY